MKDKKSMGNVFSLIRKACLVTLSSIILTPWGLCHANDTKAPEAPETSELKQPEAANTQEPPIKQRPIFELNTSYDKLTNNYGHATSYSGKFIIPTDIGMVDLTLTRQARFGLSGNHISTQLTRDINDNHYFTVGVASGSGLLWPKWRADLNTYHKFGEKKNYVFGAGFMYASNREKRNDRGILLSLTGYFDKVVMEGGAHLNRNNPGWVSSNSQYLALTFGKEKEQTFLLRGEHAKEAYQVLGNTDERVNYKSNNISAEWRYWWDPKYAFILGAKHYRNPYYKQTGANAGLRLEF